MLESVTAAQSLSPNCWVLESLSPGQKMARCLLVQLLWMRILKVVQLLKVWGFDFDKADPATCPQVTDSCRCFLVENSLTVNLEQDISPSKHKKY